MRLMITGRHVAVTPALRRYIESRMERLDRYGVRLNTLQVLLSVERFHHMAEVTGVVLGRRIQAKTSTEEMYASIDQVVDKLGAQLRKLKDRRAHHKVGDHRRLADLQPEAPRNDGVQVEVVRPALEVLSVEEAAEALREAPTGVLMFINDVTGNVQVVQRLPGGKVSLIDPERKRARAHGST
ncbi:MAG: ribosome-associated translation inhibitor RaiA [Nitrospiraceae bacterium]|nr:ribosome-associated translation inhibitor RaiA [Nitrospiraceae bacterium]